MLVCWLNGILLLLFYEASSIGGQDVLLSPDLLNEINDVMPQFVSLAMDYLRDTIRSESRASRLHRNHDPERNSFRFLLAFLGSSPYAKHLSYPAMVQSKSLQLVRDRYRLNNAQLLELTRKAAPILGLNRDVFVSDTHYPQPLPDRCPYPARVVCNPYAVHRTYDGSCNNRRYPLWGSSNKPLSRLLPAQYADGLSYPRVARDGQLLPSARLVSTTIHWDVDKPHHIYTLLLMTVGQFIDHDISRTAVVMLETKASGYGTKLEDVECGEDGCQTEGLENQACLPIAIPYNDSVFSGKKNCLMFIRSQQVPNAYHCRLGPSEQLNQVTSYIDASHVYGSTKKEMLELRDLNNPARGRLRMKRSRYDPSYQDLLPQDPDFEMCKYTDENIKCFKAGDTRVNEFAGLMAMHTVLAREHNRVESVLHYVNPGWGGERLFEESRRVVIATWQHIIYNEFLPIVLGDELMRREGLTLLKHGYSNDYDEHVNVDTSNSFATAAFRFGHTLIQSMMHAKDSNYNSFKTFPLSMTFRDPRIMYNRPELGVDAIIAGVVGLEAQTRDAFISKEVTEHLFAENPPHGLGEDLMSLNLQRGRDHGLPGYNDYRVSCGLQRAHHFSDLSNELSAEAINRFRRLYRHVDDIDLWSAGISERSIRDGLIGPTFACIIARQFKRLKVGDRFWFENNSHNPYPLNPAQLAEIRKTSLAKLLCNNLDTMTHIQPRPFLQPLNKVLHNIRTHHIIDNLATFNRQTYGSQNDRVACVALPSADLGVWKQRRYSK